MNNFQQIPDEMFILGSLFVVTNILDTSLEHELSEFNVTTKQWLLSITIKTLFTSPPSLIDAAKAIGSSYQNVKQIALKLQDRGLVMIVPDEKDARITRLVMTEKFEEFWNRTLEKGDIFKKKLFEDISTDELSNFRNVLMKIWRNIESDKG